MKLSEIQDLIKFVAKSGVNEVELQTKDVKIVIKTKNGNGKHAETVVVQAAAPAIAAPVTQVAAPPAAQAPLPAVAVVSQPEKNTTADDAKYISIKSPMIGTFYRASGPDKPAFVNVGDEVAPGKAVCIIEAMKLFNEIESDIKGKIVKILVNDASPVEYDQALFLVDPS
ncbi:MAG: acetyl-CoA carboxylase biotin carboxyl carrier protein [Bacteroidia bacterium]|nr:acetyl-CoA carboxylase biotin carboxyl carrier protein [Bacteroidia bacterium]